MKMQIIPYMGNCAYCYANSVSMLLASIGEQIPPSTIEVLSGVGLGACLLKGTNLLFFGWEIPDNGIDNALKLLGFSCKAEKIPKTEPAPLETLRKDLQKSPVVLGPLDMGYLVYNPLHRSLGGADHFIVSYSMDNNEIRIHDPAGFPCVSLSLDKLKVAWKAERVDYSKQYYRYWTAPKRIDNPTEEDIYKSAVKMFQFLYNHSQQKSEKEGWIISKEAIISFANRLKDRKATKDEIEQLTCFVLALGAKRALDYANFFDSYDVELANLKIKQADLFGKAHSLAVRKDWNATVDTLQQLAEIEENFRLTLLKK
ncbi:MAG: hypothetical protein M1575_01955 [Patescibacteria group bacterium]|nr:hypothetical protein [Patescibacteria group bacterium]MCL5095466.1 hypothetical protein [Patescibacteria group bacterium]